MPVRRDVGILVPWKSTLILGGVITLSIRENDRV